MMRISVISRWFNEEYLAPFFLGHYAWADEIVVMLDRATTDRSAEIIGRYPNARFEYFDHGGTLDDGWLAGMMSDLAAHVKGDWVIYADADEFVFYLGLEDPRLPYATEDPRVILAQAGGNLVNVWFRWVYRHATDADLDPAKPAIWQRRHGGTYTIYPGMGPRFMKPCIVRPEVRIRWTPGQHGYEANPAIRTSSIEFDGVHWQMADVELAIKRYYKNIDRLSAENIKHGWGVKGFDEAKIRAECSAHAADPMVF